MAAAAYSGARIDVTGSVLTVQSTSVTLRRGQGAGFGFGSGGPGLGGCSTMNELIKLLVHQDLNSPASALREYDVLRSFRNGVTKSLAQHVETFICV